MTYENSIMFTSSYHTTSSYGRLIKTSPNVSSDQKFVTRLCSELNNQMKSLGAKFSHKTDDQTTFLTFVEDGLINSVGDEGKCNIFSESKDHRKRPMRRYVIEFTKDHRYLVDAFASLDVSLVMSKIKRFWLTRLPRIWSNVDTARFVPKIKYQIRVWNSPVGYYLIDVVDAVVPVEYSSRVESMREVIGYPDYYDLKEKKLYERADFDIRRALFNECFNMFKK